MFRVSGEGMVFKNCVCKISNFIFKKLKKTQQYDSDEEDDDDDDDDIDEEGQTVNQRNHKSPKHAKARLDGADRRALLQSHEDGSSIGSEEDSESSANETRYN